MAVTAHNSKLRYATNDGAATNYYPSSDGLKMEGNVCATVGLVLAGGVTATIEATLGRGVFADGVAPTWVDVTKTFRDLNADAAGVASYADSNYVLQANGLCVEAIRVKVITADGSNTVGVWMRRL